jgi:hypothetical protein
MLRALSVAALARLRLVGVVLRVTAGTRRMLGRCDHRLAGVTARAWLDLGLGEAVWRVATGARLMSCIERDRGFDVALARELRVTRGAPDIGAALRLVHLMAVEAAALAGVLSRLVVVTTRARRRL